MEKEVVVLDLKEEEVEKEEVEGGGVEVLIPTAMLLSD